MTQESLQVFRPFGKLARLNRTMIVTEKLDGTNAQVVVDEEWRVFAGSRTRFITPEEDNHGFARWVKEHEDELRGLGVGRHYGEWWGKGIQRGYLLPEKRFSLFNVKRWSDPSARPACCHVVPLLYEGPFSSRMVEWQVTTLRVSGSVAAPGYDRPEGVVVYHEAAGFGFKVTLEGDDSPKSLKQSADTQTTDKDETP